MYGINLRYLSFMPNLVEFIFMDLFDLYLTASSDLGVMEWYILDSDIMCLVILVSGLLPFVKIVTDVTNVGITEKKRKCVTYYFKLFLKM